MVAVREYNCSSFLRVNSYLVRSCHDLLVMLGVLLHPLCAGDVYILRSIPMMMRSRAQSATRISFSERTSSSLAVGCGGSCVENVNFHKKVPITWLGKPKGLSPDASESVCFTHLVAFCHRVRRKQSRFRHRWSLKRAPI